MHDLIGADPALLQGLGVQPVPGGRAQFRLLQAGQGASSHRGQIIVSASQKAQEDQAAQAAAKAMGEKFAAVHILLRTEKSRISIV